MRTNDVEGVQGRFGTGVPGSGERFPLGLASMGQKVCIDTVTGGRGLVARLTAMGLHVDARVTVLNPGGPGPMILSYAGTRLAIGQGMAMQVLVRNVETTDSESSS